MLEIETKVPYERSSAGRLSAAEVNSITGEMKEVIKGSNMTFDPASTDQLSQAIDMISGTTGCRQTFLSNQNAIKLFRGADSFYAITVALYDQLTIKFTAIADTVVGDPVTDYVKVGISEYSTTAYHQVTELNSNTRVPMDFIKKDHTYVMRYDLANDRFMVVSDTIEGTGTGGGTAVTKAVNTGTGNNVFELIRIDGSDFPPLVDGAVLEMIPDTTSLLGDGNPLITLIVDGNLVGPYGLELSGTPLAPDYLKANATYFIKYVESTTKFELVKEYGPYAKLKDNVEFADVLVTGTLTETSARKYKENIEPLKDSLDKVTKLQGVSYNKKDSDKAEIGLIADDVFEVIPEVVDVFDGEVEGINYSRLVAVLIESIKELKAEVDTLKKG